MDIKVRASAFYLGFKKNGKPPVSEDGFREMREAREPGF
jgi:hypothetical protein